MTHAQTMESRCSPRMASATLCLLLGLLLGAGCAKQEAAPRVVPVVPVRVATVESKTIPVQVRAIGNVEAYSTVSIKPQVSGELVAVNFQEGQDVRRGEVLFEIDRKPFEVGLQQAAANLARDKAMADNARAQEARYSKLLQEGVVSKEQADQFRTAAETAEAQVRADQAAIDQAKLNLTYCTIASPIDGRTGILLVHPGNLVKGNDVPILVVINQILPIYATFSVPEQYLGDIKNFMAHATLHVQALPQASGAAPETGSVSFVDNSVDKTTGTIVMKATFPNSDRRLWPGQFVDVLLTLTERPNTVVVPSAAVLTGQNGAYVFVVKSNNTVEQRSVTTGASVQGETIIEKNLQPGELIVTDGQLRLVPGSKITVKTDQPAGAAAPQGKPS